jgi:galactose mutarotase-like enzyme
VTVGRYANRIAGASFTLDGVTYSLNRNNGENTLHGGDHGFDCKLWQVEDGGEGSNPWSRCVLNPRWRRRLSRSCHRARAL